MFSFNFIFSNVCHPCFCGFHYAICVTQLSVSVTKYVNQIIKREGSFWLMISEVSTHIHLTQSLWSRTSQQWVDDRAKQLTLRWSGNQQKDEEVHFCATPTGRMQPLKDAYNHLVTPSFQHMASRRHLDLNPHKSHFFLGCILQFLTYLICVHAHVHMYVCHHICGHQTTSYRSQLFPTIMWLLHIELISSSLVVHVFTSWGIV